MATTEISSTSSDSRLVSVVIPVFNSQATLPPLVDRIASVFDQLEASCEIVMVNDGSQDQSWEIISRLARQYPIVRGIKLLRNFGQHNALLAGIRSAKGEIIVTIDDDMQIPPEEIPRLLTKLDEGFDVVYGKPQQEQHGLFRDTTSLLAKKILQVSFGVEHITYISAFRAFRSKLRDAFANFQAVRVSIDVLLTWSTKNFTYILVQHEERSHGKSGYSLRKLIRHTINMTTGFSERPLRFASLTGFGFILFGLSILLYILIRYFTSHTPVPGFTFIASLISIFSGVQLFSLGVIGEYISHIHLATLNKPAYVIAEEINCSKDE